MKDFIGIFDSGIGGLTVYNIIKEYFPNENIVYLADTINCPYGTKSLDCVKKITLNNIAYLKKIGAKAIVIACNTATSSIIDELQTDNNYLIGVIEPTALFAKSISKTQNIGLLATNLTVSTHIYDKFLKGALIFSEGCSDFVLPIEAGDFHSEAMLLKIKNHLVNLPKEVDTLILGCTHFPYIKDEIQKVIPSVKLVESGIPTALKLKEVLTKSHALASINNKRKLSFLTTGNIEDAKKQLSIFNVYFDEIKKITIE